MFLVNRLPNYALSSEVIPDHKESIADFKWLSSSLGQKGTGLTMNTSRIDKKVRGK